MADPAGWRLAELLWERLAEAGLAAHDVGDTGVAAELWTAARALAETFDDDDPRRAATLNNRAVISARTGEADEAESLYRRARAGWQAAETWVARMAQAPRARSSLFHLRLEGKHRARYDELARDEHRRRLRAARAVTSANLAGLTGEGDADCDDVGLARWSRERPAGFNDERKLAAAVLLIARAPLGRDDD